MKPLKTLFTLSLMFSATALFAQVQIDKPIQLTGGSGERVISNLELPVNGSDAANKDYVDAAVAASGGSTPTMISNESPSSMSLGAAVRYCNALNESGFTDWRMPTMDEIFLVASTGGITVPNDNSSNYVWYRNVGNIMQGSYAYTGVRLSDGLVTYHYLYSSSNKYARCVR